MSLAVAALVSLLFSPPTPPKAAWFGAGDRRIQYIGRIGHETPGTASFYYAGSEARFDFKGTSLALKFKEIPYSLATSFGVKIDGAPEIPVQLALNTDQSYVVAVGLKDVVHHVEVYRRSDTYCGIGVLEGIWLNTGGTLTTPPPLPTKKIEFFGDSVTGGTNSIAFGYETQPDGNIDYFNDQAFLNDGYWGFGEIAARRLHALAYSEGVGGLSLIDHAGWFGGPDLAHTVGLVSTWDKLDPLPGQMTPWNFNQFTPDVVVIAIGQNDGRGGHIDDATWTKNWMESYFGLLQNIHAKYPKADFVLTTTVLYHDLRFDDAIKKVAQRYNFNHQHTSATYFAFNHVGRLDSGHPRWDEEEEMGKELANYLNSLPGIWGH